VLRNLKAAITVAGYNSQGQFAKDVGVSRTTMSNIINEKIEDYSVKIARNILITLRSKAIDDEFIKKITFEYIFLSDCPENGTD
jgi:DNA-binding XRE family transcriptional regulator